LTCIAAGSTEFRNTWQRARPAHGITPGLERESRRWLGRRCLIDD